MKGYSTENVPKLYASTKEICRIFGDSPRRVYNTVEAMRSHPDFKRYIKQRSSRAIRISIHGYNLYLDYETKRFMKGVTK